MRGFQSKLKTIPVTVAPNSPIIFFNDKLYHTKIVRTETGLTLHMCEQVIIFRRKIIICRVVKRWIITYPVTAIIVIVGVNKYSWFKNWQSTFIFIGITRKTIQHYSSNFRLRSCNVSVSMKTYQNKMKVWNYIYIYISKFTYTYVVLQIFVISQWIIENEEKIFISACLMCLFHVSKPSLCNTTK